MTTNIGTVSLASLALLLAGVATSDTARAERPDETKTDDEHQGHGRMTYYALGSVESADAPPVIDTFKVTKAVPVPAEFPRYCDAGLAADPAPGSASRFRGHLAFDRESGRMWLMSFGPPSNTRGPSVLMEVNPITGMNVAKAELPFLGEIGQPAYADGHLYVGLYYQSKIAKVSVDTETFGEVVGEVPVPKLPDLDLTRHRGQVFRYPFFAFSALAVTPDKNFILHSDELKEFITLDERGRVLRRSPTVSAIVAMTPVLGPNGEFLLLANSDPAAQAMKASARRFEFRSAMAAAPMSAARPVEESGVVWLLLEPKSGEILASTWRTPSRIDARGIGLVSQTVEKGTPYGRFRVAATGEDGIVNIEWAPTNVALSAVERSDLPSSEHQSALKHH